MGFSCHYRFPPMLFLCPIQLLLTLVNSVIQFSLRLNKTFLPTARVMTLSFSRTTFTTLLFCKGVTLQQSTERQCFASSTKRSCRSDDRAMFRVSPSITREMSGVVSTLRGSSLYLLTSCSAQSTMDVHVSWKTTSAYFADCIVVIVFMNISKVELKQLAVEN